MKRGPHAVDFDRNVRRKDRVYCGQSLRHVQGLAEDLPDEELQQSTPRRRGEQATLAQGHQLNIGPGRSLEHREDSRHAGGYIVNLGLRDIGNYVHEARDSQLGLWEIPDRRACAEEVLQDEWRADDGVPCVLETSPGQLQPPMFSDVLLLVPREGWY